MSFLGLGNFGEGFVTGFAESANEALKENIKRINTRIDDIAAFKLKRAISEQDERREEKELIEDAIKRGTSIYGEDSQEALMFAASILKERGSIESYNSFMNTLQQKKDIDPNFGDVIKTWVNKPKAPNDTVLTASTIADDFLGPAKGVDTTIPKGYKMDTGLVGKLFGSGADEAIQKRLQTRITSELEGRGLVKDEATNLNMPKDYFNRKKYILFTMTPQQRVDYYKSIRDDISGAYDKIQKMDAQTELEKNLDIIEKEKFDNATHQERIEILIERLKISQTNSMDLSLPVDEQKKHREEVKTTLTELSRYRDGKAEIAGMVGDVEGQLSALYKRYNSTVTPAEDKDAIKKEIQRLEVEKRKLASFTGTQADRAAFLIDEGIRAKNKEIYRQGIELAQTIDSANNDTKRIRSAERAAMTKALNSIALAKMDLDEVYGAGTFITSADGQSVTYNGKPEMKEAALKKFETLLNEVVNDSLKLAKDEREEQVIREVAYLIGAELRVSTDTTATTATTDATTTTVTKDTTDATVTKDAATATTATTTTNEETPVSDINAAQPVVAPQVPEKKEEGEVRVADVMKLFFPNDGKATDDSAFAFIQTFNEKELGNVVNREKTILNRAELLDANNGGNLKDKVKEQFNNYYKTNYPTPDDFAREVLLKTIQTDTTRMSNEQIFQKIIDIYGAGNDVQTKALRIIDDIKEARLEIEKQKRREEDAIPTLKKAKQQQEDEIKLEQQVYQEQRQRLGRI